MHPRALLVVVLVLAVAVHAACGGEPPADDDDAPIDADVSVIDAATGPDAAGARWMWQRVYYAASSAPVSIDPVAVTTGRTTRITITGTVDGTGEPAMTVVTYDETSRRAFAPITMLQHAPRPLRGGTMLITRPVLLRFPTTGTWTVYAGLDATAPSMTIEVGAAPARDCATGGGCELDCDCAITSPGEKCLGGYGLAGPFLSCARPCELDRDCGGDGTCTGADDGLDSVCYDTGPECGSTGACADGFECTAGACVATFQLSSQNRIACDDAYDCAPPLRCIVDADGAGARCEMACPTDGPWCDGAHFCGTRYQDVSGLAQVDGVCGWVGD